MILEVAEVFVKPGSGPQYEAGMQQAQRLLLETPGYIRHSLQRGIENPDRYLLFIYWESVEAHMINFRESERYPAYRSYVNACFAQPPTMQHFDLCDLG